jgi:hypothetical protein
MLVRGAHASGLIEELLRYRRSPTLFQQALQKQEPTDIGHPTVEIAIGPESAPLCLTVATHPLCKSCWRAHGELEALMEMSQGQLRFVFRFAYGRTDPGQNIVRRLLGLALAGEGQRAVEAMTAWYADPKQKRAAWSARFPLSGPADETAVADAFEWHCDWAQSAGLEHTPTFFLNGRRFPKGFELGDFKGYLRLQVRQASASRRAS